MQTHLEIHGKPAPGSARSGIYASEYRDGPDVLGFPAGNGTNGPPICYETAKDANGIAVDGAGNLIVPDWYYTVTVFQGPNMCGAVLGRFHTLTFTDGTVDAASADAASGTIVVGVYQFAGSGYGTIELCTLKGNCTSNLYGPDLNELVAVAMNKKGDCWASSGAPTALTYFKGCSEEGQTASGYLNKSPGGLDFDAHGYLVSIDSQSAQVYVYSGCNPDCRLLSGPFTLQGQSSYGHLNNDSTRYAVADTQYSQIDVYKYTPTSISYIYSFNSGLSSGNLSGVAYNPHSKE